MDLDKTYHDIDGNECNIVQMIRRCPEWAANMIQAGEDALTELADIKASPLHEVLFKTDRNGNNYVDIPIEFIKTILDRQADEVSL